MRHTQKRKSKSCSIEHLNIKITCFLYHNPLAVYSRSVMQLITWHKSRLVAVFRARRGWSGVDVSVCRVFCLKIILDCYLGYVKY